jgi:hypothetical protein
MEEGDGYGDEYGGEVGLPQPEGEDPFEALSSNPNFENIRQRITSDPQFYQQFMDQLAEQQPNLFERIQANPAAFMNLVLGGNSNVGIPTGPAANMEHQEPMIGGEEEAPNDGGI